MEREILFENLSRLAKAVQKQLGPDCEVVLHDLSRPDHSIVYIAGDVTGRRIGGPLTDFVLGLLEKDDRPEDLVGYNARTRDGKLLKSSTVFVNDEGGIPTGVFCINFNSTKLIAANRQLEQITSATTTLEVDKTFSTDVPGLLQGMIEKSLRRVLGQRDFPAADGGIATDQRRAIVADLEQQGAFRIRKATSLIADLFDVSRYTIYKDRQIVEEREM